MGQSKRKNILKKWGKKEKIIKLLNFQLYQPVGKRVYN